MRNFNKHNRFAGFSLAEVLAALLIGSMVLVAALSIYQRAQSSSASVLAKVEANRLPEEVLQLIAEDFDEIISADPDVKITIVANKLDHSFPTARVEILKTFQKDYEKVKEVKKETFEHIIWQASWDYDNDANGLVLYRSYTGMTQEDKLLDDKRADWEKDYTFIPICQGITYFRVEAYKNSELVDIWNSDNLPFGVKVTISFAEPILSETGGYEVPEESKIFRTIAIDRTRKIKLNIEQSTTVEK